MNAESSRHQARDLPHGTGRLPAPLARMMRSQRRAVGAALTSIESAMRDGPRPHGKRTFPRGGRLNASYTWALTAWAEIADREPLITHQRVKGSAETDPSGMTRPRRQVAANLIDLAPNGLSQLDIRPTDSFPGPARSTWLRENHGGEEG